MYNWSVDEKEFKNIEEIIDFLKKQPEVIWVKETNRKDKYGNKIIKVKLTPDIHLAREFFIAKYIQEKAGSLRISVTE